MTRHHKLASIAFLLLFGASAASAAIRLGAPFGEHMVLQQGVPVPIWGTGCPGGDTVNVAIAGQSLTATSDWAGRWMVILAPMKAGGPYQLLIQTGGSGPLVPSSAANARGGVELNDVVVGEVRVVSSLLNRELRMTKGSPQGKAVAQSAWIRIFSVPKQRAGGQPGVGQWTVASARAASSSMASQLYDKLKVPIGIVENPAGP